MFSHSLRQPRVSKCSGGSFIPSVIRLHDNTTTAPNTSFLHLLRIQPCTSLLLKVCYLLSQELCTLQICTVTFMLHLIFIAHVTYTQGQLLYIACSFFYSNCYFILCYLFPSVLLCYLCITKGGSIKEHLHYLI